MYCVSRVPAETLAAVVVLLIFCLGSFSNKLTLSVSDIFAKIADVPPSSIIPPKPLPANNALSPISSPPRTTRPSCVPPVNELITRLCFRSVVLVISVNTMSAVKF